MHELTDYPPEIMQQIGRAAIHWNLIEHFMNLLLAHVLGQVPEEQKGFIIFAHMNFSAKLEIWNTLMVERVMKGDADPLRNWKALSSQLKSASKLRNKVIHSLYTYLPNHGAVLTHSLSARGKLEIEMTTLTLKDISRDVDQIVSATRSITAVLNTIGALDNAEPQDGQ